MDPELQKIAAAAATALVGAMLSDGWRGTKKAFAAVCGRNRPDAAEKLSAQLDIDQRRVADAQRSGDRSVPGEVRARWDGRLGFLLDEHPEIAADLAGLSRQHAPAQAGNTVHNRASGRAQIYTSMGDMNIGRP